ncbi:membrane protein [Microlunatus sagamiharensis]|uniref:Membrane protein n=1 Tax=Microlunatus sagamiharensis TaxID=546874 RepID=A0A1H2M1S5_9ACTN|nr:YihY/virulence factor BrkB family protein [Microlunatus sagamiharensis]SDU87180.1 membrane protein [Microlunatus sagamiharensis]
MSESRGSTARPAPLGLRTRLARSKGGRAAKETLLACFRYRVLGLAAEAAYFTVLSLPPLIFGLAGLIGFVAGAFDVGEVASFQRQVLTVAGRVLTTDIVDGILAPTLDSVLSQGSAAVVSIGFLVALWSGSRAVNVFVDTITIMYGLAGRRGIVQQRLLSFVFYLALMLIGVVLVPLVLAGPGLVNRVLPARLEFLGGLYWPVVLLASGLFLAGVYNRSIPLRSRWRSGLPGAGLSLLIWVLGSVLLRLVLNASAGSTTIYGPLAAPIAVLIWLYVMSLAVLVGAAFNAAVDDVWPRLSGIDHTEEDRDPGTQPAEPSVPDPAHGRDPES